MSDISLAFIFVGALTFVKHAWDYKNHRIPDRNVEVNRLADVDAFCKYGTRHSLLNAALVMALFLIIVSERFFNMSFHFTWYFAILAAFLYRTFRFPKTFESYYKPITVDTVLEQEDVVDEEEVDE